MQEAYNGIEEYLKYSKNPHKRTCDFLSQDDAFLDM